MLSRATLVIALSIAAALAIRLEHITDPPLDFHLMRQYRFAILARGFYYAVADSVPDWRRDVAILNARHLGPLEPPILEVLASGAYQALGGEHLWVARVLSTVFWCGGGLFIYLCAQHLFSVQAALLSAAFYLFLPFGIAASRSAQPDPMMMMLLTLALWLVVRHDRDPSRARLAHAAIAAALATLVKPVAMFIILGASFGLATRRHGPRRALADRELGLVVVATALPAFAYYVACAVLVRDDLAHQMLRFMPHLLLEPFIWSAWAGMVHRTVGLSWLLIALGASVMIARGRVRALLVGLWAGYVVYGLIFALHFSRQDYYQLPLIPIVALGLGVFADAAICRLGPRRAPIAVAVGVVLIILAVGHYREEAANRREHIDAEAIVRRARMVGDAVGHSRDTIFLSADHGQLLMYYGELSGTRWPGREDLRKERLAGMPARGAAERFQALTHGRAPEYFIVTSFSELEAQPDLRELLERGFVRSVATEDHVVFDLRQPLRESNQRRPAWEAREAVETKPLR